MVKIEKYDDLGQGITKINNKVCFVKKAIPGEELEIEIIKDNKNYSEGIIKKIIKKSKERVEPICPYYNNCGGCNFLHTSEEEEKNFKINRCLNYFKRMDNYYDTENNYRNKITLHYKDNNLGFYKEKSHDIVNINNCFLVNDKINKLIKILKNNLNINDIGTILIRTNYESETLISINGEYKNINNLESSLIDNLIYNNKIIKGNNYFIECIDKYKFKVNSKSFFQINRKGLECIYNILKEFLKNKKINKALDLYSGTSVLGILISSYVKKVISIEVNKNATEDAKYNIKLNNINNLEIINGKVENYIDKFKDIDLIILDPSRSGLDKKTINYLNIIKAKYIIYISCNIHSLKRDLSLLNNYDIQKIDVVDMFKRTNNVETIVIFKII